MRLPKWSFLSRFRLRIMFQNVTNYLILFVGIWFIGIMLAMAVGMPETLDYYKSNVSDMMFTNYQYVLKSYENEDGDIITTDNKDAEKFNMTSLQHKSDTLDEEISVYGIEDDSRYVKISDLSALKGNEAYISASYADKYSLSVGDTVVLDEKYENKQYEFEVAGIYDHSQALAVFLSNEQYCEIFDMDSDAFTGYLSDSEITDIDEDEIATVITEHDITKMCDQLDHSMGSYMTYFQYLCILLSAVLIYLLTKLIIEKNENAISMTKILGYENREIASLYLLSTTIVLVVIDAASVILGVVIMKAVWRIMLFSYSGWYAFRISTCEYCGARIQTDFYDWQTEVFEIYEHIGNNLRKFLLLLGCINNKVKRLALLSVLSDKAANGNMVVVDKFACDEYKTKAVVAMLNAVGAGKKNLLVNETVDAKFAPYTFFNSNNLQSFAILFVYFSPGRKYKNTLPLPVKAKKGCFYAP